MQEIFDDLSSGEFEEKHPLDNGHTAYWNEDHTKKYANCGWCDQRGICQAFSRGVFAPAKALLEMYEGNIDDAVEAALEARLAAEKDSNDDHSAYYEGGVYSLLSAIQAGELTVEDIEEEVELGWQLPSSAGFPRVRVIAMGSEANLPDILEDILGEGPPGLDD